MGKKHNDEDDFIRKILDICCFYSLFTREQLTIKRAT